MLQITGPGEILVSDTRTDPKGRILAGGAKKAERRRAQGAARRTRRQAKQCPRDPGQKRRTYPVMFWDHGLAVAANSRFQSRATSWNRSSLAVLICTACRIRDCTGLLLPVSRRPSRMTAHRECGMQLRSRSMGALEESGPDTSAQRKELRSCLKFLAYMGGF